ncbi:MAG: hypothetical protein H6Q67_1502 [Firmicutes bacterium]|nr:hypothetical protein [Bacillota bacterium]
MLSINDLINDRLDQIEEATQKDPDGKYVKLIDKAIASSYEIRDQLPKTHVELFFDYESASTERRNLLIRACYIQGLKDGMKLFNL